MLQIATGLMMLGLMLIPALWLFSPHSAYGHTYPFGVPLGFTMVATIGVALVVATALLHKGVRGTAAEPSGRRRVSFIHLLVGGLLLAVTLFTLCWLFIWDSTYDPIGLIWLPLLLLVAFVAGVLPLIARPGRMSVAGALLALLIPVSLLATYFVVQRVDYRNLTASRADRVVRAIESYYTREGHYPENLNQLIPRDALFLPGPVVIFGQPWCYDSRTDAYGLGYVDRRHWSSPHLVVHIARTMGETESIHPLCAVEILALIDQNPDFFDAVDE